MKILKKYTSKPGVAIVISFMIFIFIGASLLMLPQATTDGRGASFIDAIFTSTSAVCVTGLIVQETSLYFSRFGHIVILALIQIGGLGIMTSYMFLSMAIGKRLLISQQVTMKGVFDTEYGDGIKRTVLFIVTSTFIIEGIGATVLAIHWSDGPLGRDLFYALFHSISAFCNAGFSLDSESLAPYQTDPTVNLTIVSLIIAGGIGFSVLINLSDLLTPSRERNRKRKLTLHTKIVLTTTGILIIVGTILFYTFEYEHTLASLSVTDKIFVSLFQSVTTRTAGFTMVDVGGLTAPTFLYFIFFMFIGGSPGSTAGGIKTSTLFVIAILVYNLFRGREDIEISGRTIPKRTVLKAVSLVTISLFTVMVFSMFLLHSEDAPFQDIIFEAFSAFGTVGLSCGLTPSLSPGGKMVVCLLMLVGRVGPLTMALIIGRKIVEKKVRFPEENIVVG
ncbi:MAG: Trk family potassium uptake protein [Candidatus Scalindua sp. AMX11]|nr:MAG: Trk family potassium uptake protein [Candidatus Scalindua sp.]NOG82742.1 Trk family potassium uptake protein [Planctomycetota bacterium]RZV95311.1 MAG: Trk family potassium uptake protein [Candidatus Scalindua sp. SCAELEC01]TDE66206.1 MAG: Trk family potassium uptake protein [Candidatus Scalindua sp. AMX11]GJQ57827.1 MAG: K+ transporter Trk [Candidatus Scalindua sp.]